MSLRFHSLDAYLFLGTRGFVSIQHVLIIKENLFDILQVSTISLTNKAKGSCYTSSTDGPIHNLECGMESCFWHFQSLCWPKRYLIFTTILTALIVARSDGTNVKRPLPPSTPPPHVNGLLSWEHIEWSCIGARLERISAISAPPIPAQHPLPILAAKCSLL